MGLNATPSSERIHIGIFGKRNAGKSSVINAVTGQNLAIVSPVKGTTTDPVYKAMELLPLGPVMVIDTPGLDDEGELGELRVHKSRQVLDKTDIALLVVDGTEELTALDEELLGRFREKNIPYLIVMNKSDLTEEKPADEQTVWVSAVTGEGVHALKERLAQLVPQNTSPYPLIADLINPGDFVVLVVPIDSAAPKGRLILPQQQVIRAVLEAGAVAMVVREHELAVCLSELGKKPVLVVTDSQAFELVASITPGDIPLTSFSILFARYKGDLKQAVEGASKLDSLRDGDRVLIAEGCTHHRQCDDIGTVKLPRWLGAHTGKELSLSFCSGTEFPDDVRDYALVIHCGGCMLNEREMKSRLARAKAQGVPMTNYGIAIAHMKGILQRSIAPLDL